LHRDISRMLTQARPHDVVVDLILEVLRETGECLPSARRVVDPPFLVDPGLGDERVVVHQSS
jgi:hypothetical protein